MDAIRTIHGDVIIIGIVMTAIKPSHEALITPKLIVCVNTASIWTQYEVYTIDKTMTIIVNKFPVQNI